MQCTRAVVVLGGNAFAAADGQLTMAGQFRFAQSALAELAPLLRANIPLLISHGNGPQVGHMLIRVEQALGAAYALPLEVCVAESEGELGYVIQQTLYNLLLELRLQRPVVSLLTQVEVHPDDPAFGAPDKPIGPFYDPVRARVLEAEGFILHEQPGHGFRRVVPSPRPRSVVESDIIHKLLHMGVLVIAAGGGGVPVIRDQHGLHGVDAVIDKDRTGALLADQLGADLFVILTGVPCAYTDFASPQQRPIGRISRNELQALAATGQFAPGSMAPKIEAILAYTDKPGRTAIICDPGSLAAALDGQAGTIVQSAPA